MSSGGGRVRVTMVVAAMGGWGGGMGWGGRVGLARRVGVAVRQDLCMVGQHGEGVTVTGAEVVVWCSGACMPRWGGVVAGWRWQGLACHVRVAPCQGGSGAVGAVAGGVAMRLVWLWWCRYSG